MTWNYPRISWFVQSVVKLLWEWLVQFICHVFTVLKVCVLLRECNWDRSGCEWEKSPLSPTLQGWLSLWLASYSPITWIVIMFFFLLSPLNVECEHRLVKMFSRCACTYVCLCVCDLLSDYVFICSSGLMQILPGRVECHQRVCQSNCVPLSPPWQRRQLYR